jgi:hypothetical protein
MSRKDNWSYDIVEEDKPKLQPLLNMLRRLRLCELTAGMVATAFHRRRVLPLIQCQLRIDEMMPGVSLEGSRISHETFPSMRLPGVCGGWWVASGRRTLTKSRCGPIKDSSPW